MANDQYEIDYFYGRHGQQRKREGQLMRAFNDEGDKRWQELSAEEKAELDARAKEAFEKPYYNEPTATPGGSGNVKNAFEISQFSPEGHLTVGMWWDRYLKAEDYYKRRGFRIENAVPEDRSVEGGHRLKEVK